MKSRLLLTIIVVSTLHCAVYAAPNAYFDIGTNDGGNDVALNGTLVPTWSLAVGPQVAHAEFFFRLRGNSPDPITYSIATTAGHAEYNTIISPSAGTITAGDGNTIDVFVQCKQASDNNIVNFTVALVGFDPIVVQFSKVCEYPKIDVSLTTNNDKQVVNGSTVVPGWAPPIAVGDQLAFYVTLTPSTAITEYEYSLDALTYPANLMNATQTIQNGNVAKQIVEGTDPSSIVLTFSCKPTTTSQSGTIEVTMNLNWEQTIKFSFQKTCDPAPANNRPGLNIGLTQGGSEIAYNGLVQPDFDPSTFTYNLGIDSMSTSIYLSLNVSALAGSANTQDFTVGLVQPTPTGVFTMSIPAGEEHGTIDANIPTSAFALNIICSNTDASASAQINLNAAGWDGISFKFTKQCKSPSLYIATFPPTSETDANVLINNVVQTDWIYTATEQNTVFYIWMPTTSAFNTQHFTASAGFDTSVINPTVSANGVAAKYSDTNTPATFQVEYNCVANNNAQGFVNLTLDTGFATALQIPPSFHWIKECTASGGNSNNDPDDDKWSPAGIFFFTVFIIGLVACLGGCCFNKVRRGRDGWDIIPGYRQLGDCIDRARGINTSYTPQDNYDYHGAGPRGSATYQADL